jgi:hypothetical protein
MVLVEPQIVRENSLTKQVAIDLKFQRGAFFFDGVWVLPRKYDKFLNG